MSWIKITIMEFNLNGQEYIQLMQLLKFTGFVDTGGDAKLHIDGGEVIVNGKQEFRRRNKLRAGDKVEFNGQTVLILL